MSAPRPRSAEPTADEIAGEARRQQRLALALVDPALQAAAREDSKLSREIDASAAWLAAHDGLTPKQFLSRKRNERRPMRAGPDFVPTIDIDDAGLAAIDGDPLVLMLALEQAEQAVEQAGGFEAAIQWANIDEADTAAHARACGVGLRMAQISIKEQRELRKVQMDLFETEEDDGGEK